MRVSDEEALAVLSPTGVVPAVRAPSGNFSNHHDAGGMIGRRVTAAEASHFIFAFGTAGVLIVQR